MSFFDHKDLENHLLQLCPKVVKHPVYVIRGTDKRPSNSHETNPSYLQTGLRPQGFSLKNVVVSQGAWRQDEMIGGKPPVVT
jgi:hypothetical protein